MARKDINFNTYVERDLQKTTVDWGTVANKLTGDLLKIREDRAAERDKIAQDTIDATDKVNEMEEYTSQSLQNLALGMSGDSAEFLRVQQDLFNRGLISQTELAQNKQRVLGDWQQFGNISKRWESDYVDMVKRAEDGDASTFEVWFNKQNAEFGNLKGVTGFVNPQTGTLSLLRRDGDGKVSSDPSRHVSLNQLQNRFNTQIQNVSKDNAIDKDLKDSVNQLGKLVIATLTTNAEGENDGGVLTVEGQKQAMETEDIKEYIQGTVNGFLSNDYKIFSVLGDIVGKDKNGNKYEPTTSRTEAEKDPSKVLVRYDSNTGLPTPIEDAPHWDAQKGVAEEAVKNRMLVMLDDVEAIKPGDVMTKYQKELIDLKKQQVNMQKDALDEKETPVGNVPPNYNQNRYEKFGKDSETDVYTYIDDELGSELQNVADDDANVAETFKNAITGVFDSNILNDLADGKYENVTYTENGKTKTYNGKGLDFQVIDDGPDYMRITFGDETITWPPIKTVKYTNDEGEIIEIPGIGGAGKMARKEKKSGFFNKDLSYRGKNYDNPNDIFNYIRYRLLEPQYKKINKISLGGGELD